MGVTVEQWRAKIGSFLQPVKSKTRLDTLKCNVKSLTLAIRLLLFFLLVAEGIEANPGPASRGRGATGGRGAARGTGAPRGRGSRDYFANLDNLSQQAERPRTRSQGFLQGQPSINDWLLSQPQQQDDIQGQTEGGQQTQSDRFSDTGSRHFQLNPILIWEFDMVVRIFFLRDIVKDNM